MRPLLALTFAALLATGASAGAADRVTVRTSLGPVKSSSDTRDLRARGTAPRGSRILVRFYRGSRRLAIRRPRLDGNRFTTSAPIKRPGAYSVRVAATRPDGSTLRVSADLDYGPTAEAPSAPD